MFHGFGVQGYEVKNHQQVVKSKQRWVPPRSSTASFPMKSYKIAKGKDRLPTTIFPGNFGGVPFNDPWFFAMSGVITLI